MAAAEVQVVKIENNFGSSAAASVTTTSGNALFVLTHTFNNQATTGTVSVTGAGGTWTNDATGTYVEFGTSHGDLAITSSPSNSGGTNTVTISDSGIGASGGLVA